MFEMVSLFSVPDIFAPPVFIFVLVDEVEVELGLYEEFVNIELFVINL